MNKIFYYFLFILLSVTIPFKSFCNTYYSKASGNWGTAATWGTACGTGTGAVPTNTDDIIICAGDIVTMDVAGGQCLSLTINGTADWTLALTTNIGAGGLTINNGGAITSTALSVLNVAGPFNVPVGATVSISGIAFSVTGTTTIDGNFDVNSSSGVKTFGDITVNSSGTWTSTGNSAFTITGSLTNNGTLTTPGTGVYTFSGAGKSLTGSAAITLGTVVITGTYTNTDAVNVNVTGVLSGAGGLTQGANSTLQLGGTPTITTLTATVNPNLVTYNGGAAQTLKATTYHNLEVAKTGGSTGTFGGNTIVNNDFIITSGTAAIGAFTTSVAGTTSITGILSITNTTGTKTYNNVIVNSGGTWTSSVIETNTINGNFIMSGGTITGAGAGIYNVAGNFSVTTGTNNTIAVGTVTVTGITNVDGTINFTSLTGTKTFANVNLNSGSTWNSTVGETYTVNNNLTMSGASVTGLAAGIFNVIGDFVTTFATTNTFGVGTMTVTGVTTNAGSIDFASATGTKTFIGKVTNTGTWTSSANEAFTIRGGITNNGAFTGGTGTYTFNTNNQTIDGANAISFGGILAITGVINITNQNTNTVSVTSNLTGSVLGSTWINDVNTNLNIGGSLLTTGTLTASANPNTINYNGAVAQTLKGTTYHNLIINKSANTATAGATFTCNGNLTISSGTLASGAFTHTVSGTTTINGGILNPSVVTTGIFNLQSLSMTAGSITGTATGNVNIATTLDVPSGSALIARCNLTVTGATTVSGTLDFNSATGIKTLADLTVNFGGIMTNTLNSAFTITGTFTNNGTFASGNGIYTFSGISKSIAGSAAITMATVAITGSYSNDNAINLIITGNLSGAGSLTQSINSNLQIGGNATIMALAASANPNLVTYNGAAAQILNGTTYHHLTINKSANIATAAAAFTCNGDLTISSGTLASGAFTHTVSGSTTISGGVLSTSIVTTGIFNLQSVSLSGGSIAGTATGSVNIATTLNIPSGSPTIGNCNMTVTGATTILGILNFNSATGVKTLGDITVSGTWQSTLNSAFTITGTLTNNGTFTGGIGIYTFSGIGKSLAGSAAITIGSATVTGTYTNNNAANVIITGNLIGAGSLTQSVNSNLQIGGNATITTLTASANPNLVTYNGAGAQTLNGTIYHHLTINKSANIATANAAFTCNGDLTLTAGTLASGAFTHTVSGSTTISGGILNPSVVTTGIFNLQSLSMSAGSITGTATGNVNVATTLNIPSGSALIARCNLTVTGATTVYGTLDFNSATGIKTLSDVTINIGGIWTSSLNSAFTISGSLTNNGTFTGGTGIYSLSGVGKSLAGNNSITLGAATITGTYTNSNVVNVIITGNLIGAGSLTQSINSNLQIGGNATITTLTATANPNTVTYNRAGAQTLKGTAYYYLTINKSANIALAGAAFTCASDLTLISGTLASGAFTHAVSGTTSITGGTLSTSSLTGVFNLQPVVMTGGSIAGTSTGNVNIGTTLSVLSGSATIGQCNVTVTGATSIDGSLTFSSITGTKTFGNITVNSIGTWNSSVVVPFTINGNLSNSGTFTANTGTYSLTGAGKTISGTLSIPTITVTGSYTNNATLDITTALSGAGTFAQGATGTLNISGATFSVTTFNATASGNTINYNLAGTQNIRVPNDGAYHNLTIGGSGIKTLLAATTINGNLSINSALDVSASNYAINLKGNWNNSGTFTAQVGTVTLNGTLSQTIGGSTPTSFNNITLSNSAGASLTSAQNLIGTLTLSAGTFTTTGQTFTLISNSSGTARIASIPATGAAFVGNLTMQRYITAGSNGWIMLGTPVTNATLQQWNDNFVTGGFPNSQYPNISGSSLVSYNEAASGVFDNGWANPTDISNLIAIGQGFSVFVMDDLSHPFPLTIDVAGAISTGDVSLPVTYTDDPAQPASEDGWNLVSNPYPSAIDWDDVTHWTKTNINTAIYMYSAGNDQYSSYNGGIGTFGQTKDIASSQSFLVQATSAAPVLKVTELAKTTGDNYVRSQQALADRILKLDLVGNGYWDESIIRFNTNATAGFDNGLDARKFYSGNSAVPSLATVAGTMDMTINSLPLLENDINIPLITRVGVSGTYTIHVDSATNMPGNSCLLLEDMLTHTYIDLRTSPSYSFYIIDTTVSPRFILHFGKPIQITASNPLCNGAANGMLATTGNGSGPWDYTWKDASGNTIQTHTNVSGSDILHNCSAGSYTVVINGNTGLCNGMLTETIELTDPLAINAQADVQNASCIGTADGGITLTVDGGTAPYSYNWSNGVITMNNPEVLPGTYSVTVTDSNGCFQQFSYDVIQDSAFIFGFNMSTDSVYLSNNNPVQFTNTSTNGTNFTWDFGDGSPNEYGANASHTYLQPGTYNVKLISIAGACSDTLTKQIIVLGSGTTGISHIIAVDNGIKISTNENLVEIFFDMVYAANVSIEVFNSIGQLVFDKLQTTVYKNKITFNFSGKPNGIYFITIQAGEQRVIKKILRM